MAVDRETRNDLRNSLIAYMTGEIRSFEFDGKVSPLRYRGKTTNDKSVRRISRFLWRNYDDLVDHPISVTPQCWAAFRRILAFLHTDLEIEKPQGQDAWPFHDYEEWLRNESILAGIRLPEYDPAIHGRPANPWWNRIPTRVGLAIIGALLIPILIFLLWPR